MSQRTSQPPPQVGDTLRVRLSASRRDAGATGVVTRVRFSSGRWAAAELEIADQRRWFLKGELEVPPPPPPPRRVAPPADFLRIARRLRQGRPQPTLFLYLGRGIARTLAGGGRAGGPRRCRPGRWTAHHPRRADRALCARRTRWTPAQHPLRRGTRPRHPARWALSCVRRGHRARRGGGAGEGGSGVVIGAFASVRSQA
ncbi:MAG: hypothetical protein WCK70_04975 [Chloroflexales bacterium]